MSKKRVMVDMSASLIHHGHIRLLKRASDLGDVVVGLTSDDEIFNKKGFQPELNFSQRKEILESIRYVDEVIETPRLPLEEKSFSLVDLILFGFASGILISSILFVFVPYFKNKIRIDAVN